MSPGLREELPQRFPQCTFFFEPADITSQILNFGLPAPIDVQVVGVNRGNLAVAQKLRREMAKIAGRCRRPPSPDDGSAGLAPGRGPCHGLGTGADPAGRDRKRAGVAQFDHAGGAQLLGQPDEPRQLPRGHANPALPHRLAWIP